MKPNINEYYRLMVSPYLYSLQKSLDKRRTVLTYNYVSKMSVS